MLKFFYGRQIKKDTWAQGLTRHSNEQIEAMMMKDLRTISAILGKNKFIIGDEPCEDDAAIFGNLAGFVWGIQSESNYGKLVKGNLMIHTTLVKMTAPRKPFNTFNFQRN